MTSTRSDQHSPRLALAMQSETDYQSCAVRLKALADPDRLKIINALFRGDRSVSALVDELELPMDKVSHHLGVLRAAQLVQTRKQGKFVIYSLSPEIVATHTANDLIKTIDLGCCQLDLVQPEAAESAKPAKKGVAPKRSR